jgi:hypothetical protein
MNEECKELPNCIDTKNISMDKIRQHAVLCNIPVTKVVNGKVVKRNRRELCRDIKKQSKKQQSSPPPQSSLQIDDNEEECKELPNCLDTKNVSMDKIRQHAGTCNIPVTKVVNGKVIKRNRRELCRDIKKQSKKQQSSQSSSQKYDSEEECKNIPNCLKNTKKYPINRLRKIAVKCGIDIYKTEKINKKLKTRKELCDEIKTNSKRDYECKNIPNCLKNTKNYPVTRVREFAKTCGIELHKTTFERKLKTRIELCNDIGIKLQGSSKPSPNLSDSKKIPNCEIDEYNFPLIKLREIAILKFGINPRKFVVEGRNIFTGKVKGKWVFKSRNELCQEINNV